MVRAKMKCVSVTVEENSAHVVLNPVVNGSDENKKFYKYTPGGNVTLNIVSHETAAQFEPGCEYYVDFTPVRETVE